MLRKKSGISSTVLYVPIPENEIRKTLNKEHYDCWRRGLELFAEEKNIILPPRPAKPNMELAA